MDLLDRLLGHDSWTTRQLLELVESRRERAPVSLALFKHGQQTVQSLVV